MASNQKDSSEDVESNLQERENDEDTSNSDIDSSSTEVGIFHAQKLLACMQVNSVNIVYYVTTRITL